MLVKPKVVLQSFFVLLVGLGDLRAQVQEYNTKNPENAVQEGDHIVSVNGSSQDTEMVISADFIGSRKYPRKKAALPWHVLGRKFVPALRVEHNN